MESLITEYVSEVLTFLVGIAAALLGFFGVRSSSRSQANPSFANSALEALAKAGQLSGELSAARLELSRIQVSLEAAERRALLAEQRANELQTALAQTTARLDVAERQLTQLLSTVGTRLVPTEVTPKQHITVDVNMTDPITGEPADTQ